MDCQIDIMISIAEMYLLKIHDSDLYFIINLKLYFRYVYITLQICLQFIIDPDLYLRSILVFHLDLYLHLIIDLELHFRSVFVFLWDLVLNFCLYACMAAFRFCYIPACWAELGNACYASNFYEIWICNLITDLCFPFRHETNNDETIIIELLWVGAIYPIVTSHWILI